ncbi:MAG: hypothetical protein ACKOW5_13110, partial [Actinomycetales bacterium]
EEIAQAKSLIGLLAMTSVGQLGCSLECSLSGKVPQWTYQSAVPRMVEALAGFDVAGVTSGPPYPGTSEARVSVGNVGSASDFTAGFAVSGEGMCVAIAAKGPGLFLRPTSFQAQPGTLGPNGICVAA